MADITEQLRDQTIPQGDLRPLCLRAAAEIDRLRYGIDAARVGLLRVERQAEETRATVTQSMREVAGQ